MAETFNLNGEEFVVDEPQDSFVLDGEEFVLDGVSGGPEETFDFQGQIDSQESNQSNPFPGISLSEEVDDFDFRAELSKADTREEQKAIIENKFGTGGFGVNDSGNFFITPQGLSKIGQQEGRSEVDKDKNVFIDSPFQVNLNDVADLRGIAAPTAGAIIGGTATASTGFIPGLLLTSAGAMLAKTIDELGDHFSGINKQPFGEVGSDIADEGIFSALAEGVLRFIGRPFANKLLGPNTNVRERAFTATGEIPPVKSTLDQERLDLVQRAQEIGGQPSIYQASVDDTKRMASELTSRAQSVADAVTGNPREFRNKEAILREAKRIEDEAAKAVPSGALTETDTVGAVNKFLVDSEKGFLRAEREASKKVEDATNKAVQAVRTIGRKGGNTGELVKEMIIRAKNTFSQEAKSLYRKVDDLAGGEKVVPTQPIKNVAKRILDDLPKKVQKKKKKKLGEGDGDQKESKTPILISRELREQLEGIANMEEFISFEQAINTKIAFSSAEFNPELTKSVGNYNSGLFRRAVDDAMEIGGGKIPGINEAYAEARKFYSENIPKYKDLLVAKVTRDLSRRGSVQPELVVEAITASKSKSQLENIKELVGPQMWEEVKRERVNKMLLEAEGVDGSISGPRLFSEIKKMGQGFGVVFDKDSQSINNLAKTLAAKQGKVDLSLVAESDLKTALQEAIKATAERDAFMEINFIKALRSGSKNFEDAIAYLYKSDSPKQILEAKKFFKEGSQEWGSIKLSLIKRSLKNLIGISDDGLEQILSPGKFVDELRKHSPVLKAALGENHFKELMKFGNVASLLNKNRSGGGLVAASVALSPLRALSSKHKIAGLGKAGLFLAKINLLSNFLSSDVAVKQFTTGLGSVATRKAFDNTSRATLQILQNEMRSFADGAIEGLENIDEDFIDGITDDVGNKIRNRLFINFENIEEL